MLPRFIRTPLRVFLVITMIVIAVPFQSLWLLLRLPKPWLLPLAFHRMALKIINARIRIHGPLPPPGTLILANHISWLDIIVIGAVLPVNFVAKADIAAWPVFGFLAKLQRTIFIDRDRRTDAANQRNALQLRLAKGDRLVLFPEGTTGDGTLVSTFKSALLASAEIQEHPTDDPTDEKKSRRRKRKKNVDDIRVQPLSLVFSEICGMPMGRRARIAYAWIGNTSLIKLMLFTIGGEPVTLDLVFHPITTLSEAGGRKELAKAAHRRVQAGVSAFTVGHGLRMLEDIGLQELATEPENV